MRKVIFYGYEPSGRVSGSAREFDSLVRDRLRFPLKGSGDLVT